MGKMAAWEIKISGFPNRAFIIGTKKFLHSVVRHFEDNWGIFRNDMVINEISETYIKKHKVTDDLLLDERKRKKEKE